MKILRWTLFIILLLVAGCFGFMKLSSEKLPTGTMGPEAEALADDMLLALNQPAWDTLRYVSWTFFRGTNHYKWDKKLNNAIVSWNENEVLFQLDSQKALVYQNGTRVTDEPTINKLKSDAWSNWCNDSFWFCAPFKIRDPGTERSVIEKEGKKGLLVQYTSGGVTPGDSYLYWLDDKNIPESWQMWTQILPIQGIQNTWEGWTELYGGAMISTAHSTKGINMALSNVKSGMSPEDIGAKASDFNI